MTMGTVRGLGLGQDLAVLVFPNTEEKEGKSGGENPELGAARDFGLWLPAKELSGYEKSEGGPKDESENLREQLPDGKRGVHGALQSGDEIGGGEEDGNALRDFGQVGDGQRRAGKKNQRKPEELVEDLRFLHGIGDAGDDQPKGCEGNGTDGHEHK